MSESEGRRERERAGVGGRVENKGGRRKGRKRGRRRGWGDVTRGGGVVLLG